MIPQSKKAVTDKDFGRSIITKCKEVKLSSLMMERYFEILKKIEELKEVFNEEIEGIKLKI